MSLIPPAFEEHDREQREYYRRSTRRGMVPTGSPYLRRHIDALFRFGDLRAGERVLEVGCGMGRYTLLLAERGVRIEAMDLSPELLERLRAFDGGRFTIPLYCCDVLAPPAELEPGFDAVVALFAMHHVHSLEASIVAMAALLRPGGRLVFLEPNPYNPLYYLQILLTPGMSWAAERGMRDMRPARMIAAMRAAGLVRARHARFGFFPPFITNRRGGPRMEGMLESVPLWRAILPFQLFRGDLV